MSVQKEFKLNLPKKKRLRFRLIVHTFEDGADYPVVTHIFNGSTREEAQGYYKAHLKSDRFLKGCKGGNYQGLVCRNVQKWQQLTPTGWADMPG